ncbi:hypothetical protein ACFQU2_08540 [Siccirubricoccus deserti]
MFSLTARHDRTEAWKELLALSNQAAAEGVPIRPVFPPRPIGILMGLLGSQNPFSGTPSYKAIAHLPLAERVAAMRDPAMRARILGEDRFSGSNFPLLTRLSFERMFPFGDPPNYAPPKETSIAAQAARERRTPEEVAYDMLLADEGNSFIFCALVNYFNTTWSRAASCCATPTPSSACRTAARMSASSPTAASRRLSWLTGAASVACPSKSWCGARPAIPPAPRARRPRHAARRDEGGHQRHRLRQASAGTPRHALRPAGRRAAADAEGARLRRHHRRRRHHLPPWRGDRGAAGQAGALRRLSLHPRACGLIVH